MDSTKAIVCDFSRVLLFAKDESYQGSLNALCKLLSAKNPDFDFWAYFTLNDELLEFLSTLPKNIPVYIFTSDAIQNHPAVASKIKESTTGVMSAKNMSVSKSSPKAYTRIAQRIGVDPHCIIYIDDQIINCTAAQEAGLTTLLHKNNNETIRCVTHVLLPGGI